MLYIEPQEPEVNFHAISIAFLNNNTGFYI